MADLYQWVISFLKDYALTIQQSIHTGETIQPEDHYQEKDIVIKPLYLFHAMNMSSISIYPSLSDYTYYPRILNKSWIFDLNSTYLKPNDQIKSLNDLDRHLLNKEISVGIMRYFQTVYENTPCCIETKYLKEQDHLHLKELYHKLPEYIFFNTEKSKIQFSRNSFEDPSCQTAVKKDIQVPFYHYSSRLDQGQAFIDVRKTNNLMNLNMNDSEYKQFLGELDRVFKAKLLFYAGFYKESAHLLKQVLYNEYYRQNRIHQERKSNVGTFYGTQEELLINDDFVISVFKGIHEDIFDHTDNSFNLKGYLRKNPDLTRSQFISETTLLKNESILQSYSRDGSMFELHIKKVCNY